MKISNVRITVLESSFRKDLLDKYASNPWKPCQKFQDGQEFLTDGIFMPPGFCSWAWADIEKYVQVLAHGADLSGSKPGLTVVCCTDGFRPVYFLLERV